MSISFHFDRQHFVRFELWNTARPVDPILISPRPLDLRHPNSSSACFSFTVTALPPYLSRAPFIPNVSILSTLSFLCRPPLFCRPSEQVHLIRRRRFIERHMPYLLPLLVSTVRCSSDDRPCISVPSPILCPKHANTLHKPPFIHNSIWKRPPAALA